MSSTALKPTKRKRVPDALRRRAAVSCDRCKLRRAKCIRATAESACSNCLSSRTECQSTLPRKQRVYGSLESLSLRYRALDALVKGLLPDEDGHDLDTLYRVAADKGITMPAIDDQTPTQDIFAHPEAQSQSPPCQTTRSGSVKSTTSLNNPFVVRPAQKPTDERLIPAPHGVGHYVGPASSFGFAVTARTLVARCTACQNCRRPRKQQMETRADFVSLSTSKALEPRNPERGIEGVEGTTSEPDGVIPRLPTGGMPSTPGSSLFPRANNDRISEFLPARSTADALVQAFFQNIHPNYPLFHRSWFQVHYEAIWERKNDFVRDLDPGWMSCLSMIFVFGAQVLELHDLQQAAIIQRRYTSLVHQTLSRLVSTTSIWNVQALLLLQLYEHNAGERNASWMFLGCASRMAVALGMHREGTSVGFDPIERNIRKRVWWTLYIFEKLLSVILGRPSAIDESEISVQLPEESMFENGDTPADYTHYFLSLTRLLERVKCKMYPLPDNENAGSLSYLLLSAKELLDALDSWYSGLPNHLLPITASLVGKQLRAVLLLHVCHLYAKVLVTKPLLVHRVSMELESLEQRETTVPNLPQDVISLSRECVDAAEKSLSYLKILFEAGLLDGVSWIDAYYIYHSIFILCLDILVRPIDSADSKEDLQRKALIKSSVEITRRTRLAPTFRTLAQVASQFAGSVGALDEPNSSAEGDDTPNSQASPPGRMQLASIIQPPLGHDIQPPTFNTWYEANFTGLPWNCFDMGVYDSVIFSEPQNDFINDNLLALPLVNNIVPGPSRSEGGGFTAIRQADDWATRALRERGGGYT